MTQSQEQESTGGEIEVPQKYQAFFNRFSEIDQISLNDYKPVHLIGYFCRKFEEAYRNPYQFKFNTPSPTKSFEVFQIKKLAQVLSSRPEILIGYIDWIFQEKIPKTKAPIRSISFLTKEENVQDYKRVFINPQKSVSSTTISRSTPLPAQFQKVLQARNLKIETFGDLSFLAQIGNKPENIEKIFEELVKVGLNLDELKKVI